MNEQREHNLVPMARAILLGLLVVFVGVVAALFVARRGDVAPRPTGPSSDPLQVVLDRLSAGEGFDYEVTEEERKLFHITAERVVTSREGTYELEGVAIEVEHEDGNTYRVEAARARYQEKGRDKRTTLEGDAVARSSSGAEISSEGFELRRGGKLISSMGPVEFRMRGRLTGSSRRFDAYLDRDRYQFAGAVRVQSIGKGPGVELKGQRLTYEEAERRIILDGGVEMTRGDDELRADRLSALLSEQSSEVEFVSARWNVVGGQTLGDDIDSRIDFEADEVALEFDAASGAPTRGQFMVERGGQVVIQQSDGSGLANRMLASFVEVDFSAGQMERVEAEGPVLLREFLLHSPETILLDACGQRAVAEFAQSGGLARLELADQVTLNRPDLQANGDRLEVEQDDTSMTVRGRPAEVHTRRGRLTAPRITYRSDKERLEARGGVRAELDSASGVSMLRDSEDEGAPVLVTAETATWETGRREFEFSGAVRAWEGADFIVAETLRGEEGGRRLTAEGDVKTFIAPRQKESAEENGSSEPIEVTAGKLVYERAERVVLYTGSPVARQAGRVVRCAELRLFLSPASELEKLLCEGNVTIDDPAASRSVRGERAEYSHEQQVVEVFGNPAVLKDPDGTEVRGPMVVYDLDKGTARVSSGGQRPPERREPPS